MEPTFFLSIYTLNLFKTGAYASNELLFYDGSSMKHSG